MTGLVFVDTNVLVYERDASEPEKQRRAHEWMEHLWRTRTGRLSFQVLQELYVTLTRKLDPGLSISAARELVRDLASWRPVQIDLPLMETAWLVYDRFSLSWWDALIVAAAQSSGCRFLLTEDLQAGQRFDQLQVIDPFAMPQASPATILEA